jgi:hypothetical protein
VGGVPFPPPPPGPVRHELSPAGRMGKLMVRYGRAALVTLRMKPSTAAPDTARRIVEDACATWGMSARLTADASVVAGALVLHSVRHARSPLRLTVRRRGTAMLIEVEDGGTALPARRRGPGTTEPYGLDLVTQVADKFGYDWAPAGRRLWARVAHRGEVASPAAMPVARAMR